MIGPRFSQAGHKVKRGTRNESRVFLFHPGGVCTNYLRLFGRCARAEPAADFAALLDLGFRRTLDAAEAAFLLVTLLLRLRAISKPPFFCNRDSVIYEIAYIQIYSLPQFTTS